MEKRLKNFGNSVTMIEMARKKTTRPAKISDIHSIAKKAITEGTYLPVEHAKLRLNQREVTLPELEYVIEKGRREPKKDEFKLEHNAWNYAIKGKTVDNRNLRIAVSLDEKTKVLIITVIDLDK